jgi:hypothetical protein
VAADELGGAVRDDVRAPLDRAEQVRRRQRVVDQQRYIVFLCDRRHFLNREHGDVRIAERFTVDQFGVGADCLFECGRIARIDEGDFDAELR